MTEREAAGPALGRGTFDLLERGLERVTARAVRSPGPASFGAAAALGRLRNRLSRRWPSPEQVRTLFPHLDKGEAEDVAWAIGGLEARNRLLVACLRRGGLEPLRGLLRTPTALADLRPPLILGTFHMGALHALGLALERLPGPVLALRQGPLYTPRPPLTIVTSAGGEQARAAAFQRALVHLKSGGFVALALDLPAGPGISVPCLGRTLELARGPFALARITGAPLVPLAASWERGGVEVQVGDVIAPAAAVEAPAEDSAAKSIRWEGTLAAAAAGWLERYVRETPGELGLGLLRSLLGEEIA
ncbi:MAG TPA: hypothetical protein VEG34_14170 [Thermoanaerobaculia bacterium]|nr:hypothetical protein [Thermoanaerobaculia bacterium]